jgi:hypothetical protein
MRSCLLVHGHRRGRLIWLLAIASAALGCLLPQAAGAAGFALSSTAKPRAACAESKSGGATCEAILVPTVPAGSAEATGPELEGTGELGGFDPKDLREAYSLPEKGGSGNTVAIVDAFDDPHAESDLQKYREKYKVYYKGTETACTEANGCFKKVNQKGEAKNYPSEGWVGEISLDLDMVSAACGECKILLVEANGEGISNLGPADEEAETLGANVVSNSWNKGFEGTEPEEVDSAEESEDDKYFNHEKIPILFAGGDYGYSVRYPAVSQYVIAVGGTRLKRETESSRKWTEEAWSNASYGFREKGRGTGSGCSKYEIKPKWQTDKPCTHRIETDVAAVAAPESPVSVYDGGWTNYGGTSASSPFVAGVEGLSTSRDRSLKAEAFYDAGSKGALFDITKGTNGTCTPPSEDEYYCTAKTGFDGPTGWGTPNGALTFTSAPVVTTGAASSVTETEATLHGTVNPEGTATKYCFEYGATLSYGSKTGEASAGAGESTVEEGKTVAALAASTTYHFRIVAKNSEGTTDGADQVFKTTGKPSVETKPATSISDAGATLNGAVNADGAETKYYFEYGPTTSYGSKTVEASAGAGESSVEETKAIKGLAANETYHFRVVATNSNGTTYGADRVFATTGRPLAESKLAASISETEATLKGAVNPDGAETKYYFEYGTSNSYGTKTAEVSAGSGTSTVEASQTIKGLTAGTTYHFRIVAKNNNGTIGGLDQAFGTVGKPFAETKQASSVTKTGATLRGLVNPEGSETKYYFEYGPTTAYGSKTAEVSAGAGTGNVEESKAITGLEGEALYHYRIVATNAKGTSDGPDMEVTTPWTLQVLPDGAGAQENELMAVSCTSSTACTAVGRTYVSSETALVERWNGTEWKIQETPSPLGASQVALMGVSCSSATACIAVGYSQVGEEDKTLAEQWNGTEWKLLEAPSEMSSIFESVSCSSSTACTAVGGTASNSLAERWNGTEWKVQETPAPSGAKDSFLTGVSCSAAEECVATESYEEKPRLAAIVRWNGKEWKSQEAPKPSPVEGTVEETWLNGVSCTSSTACVAAGTYKTERYEAGWIARWNGTGWKLEEPSRGTWADTQLEGVSCTSSTACVAAGTGLKSDTEDDVPDAERWNGTEWKLEGPSYLTGTSTSTIIEGVSCGSSSSCMQIGWGWYEATDTRVTIADVYE